MEGHVLEHVLKSVPSLSVGAWSYVFSGLHPTTLRCVDHENLTCRPGVAHVPSSPAAGGKPFLEQLRCAELGSCLEAGFTCYRLIGVGGLPAVP